MHMDPKEIVLVLWGVGCDETLAVGWVSRLRAQGRRVYLVGVSGRRNRGQYGMSLEPDMGLGEGLGLASRAGLMIVPCDPEVLQRLRDDPRIDDLLVLAAQSGARLLVHPSAQKIVAGLAPGAQMGDLNPDSEGER